MQLTTGQLIDTLKTGQVAYNESGYCAMYNEKGHLTIWLDKSGRHDREDGIAFEVFLPHVQKDRWTIQPDYVTFDVAMRALIHDSKKVVYVHSKQVCYEFSLTNSLCIFHVLAKDGISFENLTMGNWLIEVN